jgi:two-component system, OmpR family, alkaline phosphatase synthesis response regulator PhoP
MISSAGSPTILVVDDDPDILESVSSFLEAHGYRVLTASNGAEGVRLARREPPDLIILDVIMQERTEGFFVAQQIRRTVQLEHVPIFMLTSFYEVEKAFLVPPESAWLPHEEFLHKPVRLPLLLEKIRFHLGLGERNPATPVGAAGAP